ncbi:MAG: hypothetical protein HRT80_13400 [Henriciella sp.]|nr:hypothetical protein [Henriciella sp.]
MLLLAAASLGYFANGAQAHVRIMPGETISLMICSTGANRMLDMEIPGEPAEETKGTSCGDCAAPSALLPPEVRHIQPRVLFAQPLPAQMPEAVSPRSPLWPGAPPQGPPPFHNA